MNMRVTGSYPAGLTSPVDKRIGDAFPIIEEVYKHLSQLKYLAENSEKFVGKQVEFRANTELGVIEWRYDDQPEWLVLVSYDELVGVDLSSMEETLNQIIDNGVQTLTDKIINGMIHAGNISYLPSGTGAVATTVQSKLREIVSVKDFGQIGPSAFSAAAVSAEGRVVVIPVAGDDTVLPADYTNTLFEYNGSRPMRMTHTPSVSGVAKKALKAQFPAAHPLSVRSAFHIEAQALGSGKNGPNSADYGATIAIHKNGYGADISPPAGEIDGLSIFVRQDGPKGEPSGGENSSDASGILVNIQNVEDVGFTSAWEATTSNVERAGDTITKSIQTQIGVLTQNGVGAPSYGYVCVASTGILGDAYYAGASGAAKWTNVLNAPGSMRIDAAGNYRAFSPEWAGGAWSVHRQPGANGSTQITHRGTGALFLFAQDAGAVQFGTNGNIRWAVNSEGNLQPATNNTVNVGGPTSRPSTLFSHALNLGTNSSNGVIYRSGVGSPEGVLSAPVGSIYTRTDGGAGTTLYVKESGALSTGWVAK